MARGQNTPKRAARRRSSALAAAEAAAGGKRKKTPEQIKAKEARIAERVEQARQRIEQGVKALGSAEELRGYLRVMSRVPQYSGLNTLLIRSQRPDATVVKSRSAWEKDGRTLKDGERPIHILQPRRFFPVEETDTATGEARKRMVPFKFGTGSVYDISQTDGPAVAPPPAPKPLTGESEEAKALVRRLFEWTVRAGVSAEGVETLPAGVEVQTVGDQIAIAKALPADQRAYLLARECARVALGRSEAKLEAKRRLDPTDQELAVNAAAYAIAAAEGLDAQQASFPNLAAAAAEQKRMERMLQAVQRVCAEVLILPEEPAPAATP